MAKKTKAAATKLTKEQKKAVKEALKKFESKVVRVFDDLRAAEIVRRVC